MRVTRVLHLTDAALTSYVWDGETFMPEISFDHSDADRSEFRAYLQREPDKVTALLVAVAEEEHRIESIPHARPSEKRAIAKRRLAKTFRRTEYRSFQLQGEDPRREHHDRLLLSALTRPAIISPWLDVLDESRVPVTGVYSTTVVSKQLLARLGIGTKKTLLITHYCDGRVRHTFFGNMNINGTRLLPKPPTAALQDAQGIARRLEESLRYFDPSYIPKPGTEVDAVIVADRHITASLGNNLPRSDFFLCHTFSVQQLARKIGVKLRDEKNLIERIFAHLIREDTITQDYSTERDRRYAVMTRARHYARAASFALMLVAFAFAGQNAAQIYQDLQLNDSQTNSIDQLMRTMRNDREMLQDLPVDPEELERSIETFNTLADQSVDAQLVMQTIGGVLDRHPDIRVEEFGWRTETTDADTNSDGPKNPVPSRIAIEIQGVVNGPRDDVVRALSRVDGFVAALTERPEIIDVERVRTPLDIRPQVQLTGEFGTEQQTDPAGFEIHMALVRAFDEQEPGR